MAGSHLTSVDSVDQLDDELFELLAEAYSTKQDSFPEINFSDDQCMDPLETEADWDALHDLIQRELRTDDHAKHLKEDSEMRRQLEEEIRLIYSTRRAELVHHGIGYPSTYVEQMAPRLEAIIGMPNNKLPIQVVTDILGLISPLTLVAPAEYLDATEQAVQLAVGRIIRFLEEDPELADDQPVGFTTSLAESDSPQQILQKNADESLEFQQVPEQAHQGCNLNEVATTSSPEFPASPTGGGARDEDLLLLDNPVTQVTLDNVDDEEDPYRDMPVLSPILCERAEPEPSLDNNQISKIGPCCEGIALATYRRLFFRQDKYQNRN